jgi:hypothetical protein
MRRPRKDSLWIPAASGFVVLAFVLAGQGFVLSKVLGGHAGTRGHLSEAVLKAIFHNSHETGDR